MAYSTLMRSHLFVSSATACAVLFAVCSPAQAQLTEPFDHLHLAVPDVEQARDWYIQHMGGNVGETPDTVSWGTWPVDHPLPIQLLFTLSDRARPSAGMHRNWSRKDTSVGLPSAYSDTGIENVGAGRGGHANW